MQPLFFSITSCADVELGLARPSLLDLRVYHQPDLRPRGLILIIPGCGGDNDGDYQRHLCSFIAREFGLVVLSVDYHCLFNRHALGGDFYFDEIDLMLLRELCEQLGLGDFYEQMSREVLFALAVVNKRVEFLKSQGQLPPNERPIFVNSLAPAKGEYQNFGLMQAVDLINALLFVKKNLSFDLRGGGCLLALAARPRYARRRWLAARVAGQPRAAEKIRHGPAAQGRQGRVASL